MLILWSIKNNYIYGYIKVRYEKAIIFIGILSLAIGRTGTGANKGVLVLPHPQLLRSNQSGIELP
jgi:hypothetical protein